MTALLQFGRDQVHLVMDAERYNVGAVHPHSHGLPDILHDADPHLPERQPERPECYPLQLGDPMQMIIGIDGSSECGARERCGALTDCGL